MSANLNGFDRVAGFYDRAKRIVFGKAIFESRTHFLNRIRPGGNVLIIGGGSGETLPALLALNPECRIWFLDASSKMLELARHRMKAKSKDNILFVHGTKDHLPEGIVFDAVITDFFLDLFSGKAVGRIAGLVTRQLHPMGVWLVADFVNAGRWWQRTMLWSMYRFFGLACNIEATRLPPWQKQITSAGMEAIASTIFYGGFITSIVYRKKSAHLALCPEQIILRS